MELEKIHLFEKIQGQVEGLHKEIGLLSKKNPNDAVSKFKLKFINQTLQEANVILAENYKPFDDFDTFDEDTIPTNSDVTMIFEQYLGCLEKFRSDNIRIKNGNWCWIVDGSDDNIRTTPRMSKK